ncbi:hypothetical protein NU219Hw_g4365t1 [Hortaea werneckii]
MDPLAQLSQKLNPEQTNQSRYQQLHQQQPTPDSAPPPYMPSEHDDYEDDSDEDNEPDDQHPPSTPLKLTLNAAHNIQGCNNLVPTSPSPLADATRFTTLLLAAVKQLNSASELASSSASRRFPASKRAPPLTVDLTINCGVTIVGDRNVVGNVSLKPKAPAQAFAGPAATHPPPSTATITAAGAAGGVAGHAVAGAKRKADDDDDEVSGEGRFAKKVDLG